MEQIENPGKLSREPDGYKVVFERLLPFGITAVWKALADPKKMSVWFMETEMDFRVGGAMTIRLGDEANTESPGTITRIEEEKIFEFFWETELVTYELEKKGADKTLLRLTHSKVAGEWAKSVPAGWHFILDLLHETLAERVSPYASEKAATERKEQLKAQYAKLYEHL